MLFKSNLPLLKMRKQSQEGAKTCWKKRLKTSKIFKKKLCLEQEVHRGRRLAVWEI